MKYHSNILLRYVSMAPLALAFERYLECRIYQSLELERPILDLGCGDGVFAHVLFDEKVDTGIDPDENEIIRARELGAYHELIVNKGDAIEKPDASFRTVYSNSVLEHIADLNPVLNEVNRILVEGGYFYLTVPTHRFEQYSVFSRLLRKLGLNELSIRYQVFYNRFWKQIHRYPLEKWEDIVRQHGFKIESSFTYDSIDICTLNDALVVFGFLSFLIKKIMNRWVLFPKFKRAVLSPVVSIFERLLSNDKRNTDGGLVFISCIKVKGI